MSTEATAEVEEDAIIAAVSDYLDGVLPADQKAAIEQRIASEQAWRTVHVEMLETRQALSGMLKARAPATFDQDVTSTIHKRSAGRFFGRRTLGDRVPFGVLLVVALVALAVIAFLLHGSSTGTLKP